jgi:hypothetical protein
MEKHQPDHGSEKFNNPIEASEQSSPESLIKDPALITISIRRHGAYERGDKVPVQRGQLTSETFGGVRQVAEEWVAKLPEAANVSIIASPTYMPAQRPVSDAARERHPEARERIEPRRASVTSSLYADELRKRFGAEYGGYLANADLSAQGRAAREAAGIEDSPNSRALDRRLGDIFENTTKEQSEFIPDFFKLLGSTYGGLTPDFWRDFIHGELPDDLNQAYLKAGGEPAVIKAAKAIEVINEVSEQPRSQLKDVALIISHEEVIGSLAFQIQEYVRDHNLASQETVGKLDATKFSYNQGFDVHIDHEGNAIVQISGEDIRVNINSLKDYVDAKAGKQTLEHPESNG